MRLWILGIIFSYPPVYAQNCPFKATDSSAVSLASTTAGTIQGLLDSKNQCSANFTEAVKSVQGLPEMMGSVRDPLRELEVKRDFINKEIAKAISDSGAAGSSYIEFLLEEKLKTDRLIEQEKLNSRSLQKEASREKVLGLTWNLLSATSNAMSDPNSACAQNISQKYGSQILTLGMGAISSAGYLLSSTAGGGITLAAGLLSQVMDLFNRMTPRALKDFEQMNQTLDLACLYNNIINLSCEMKDANSLQARTRIQEEAKKIKNGSVYAQVIAADEIKDDIGNIISAAVTQDLSIITGNSGSSAFENEIQELFKEKETSSERDGWEKIIRQFNFIKRFLVTDKAAYDALTTTQKEWVNTGLSYVMRPAERLLMTEGVSTTNASGGTINSLDLLRNHHVTIEKLFKSKLSEASGAGGSGGLQYDSSQELHRAINIGENLAKAEYTKRMYDGLKKQLAESGKDQQPDGKALLAQIQESQNVITKYESWLSVDFNDPEYKNSLSKAAVELKKSLAARRDDSFTIRERVKEVLSQPFKKYQQLIGVGESADNESLFANPFKPARRVVSDFDRFRSLRDVYKQTADPNIELRDQNLVNETRRLFEDDSSLLKRNFVEGLKSMHERIESSPDPVVAKRMYSQLCGISYSLPASTPEHVVKTCRAMMPESMKNYLPLGGVREQPDCSYYRYSREQTRKDFFGTGRSLSVPAEKSQGQQ